MLSWPLPKLQDPPESRGEYGSADYDPATATFSTSAKGRGIADCGESASWVFDGKDFHLAEATWQDRCGGGSAGDWPVIWRSRTVRR